MAQHAALRRAAARRSVMADTYMRQSARKVLHVNALLSDLRKRKYCLTDGFYAGAVAAVHDNRKMVRHAIVDEMRGMQVRNG